MPTWWPGGWSPRISWAARCALYPERAASAIARSRARCGPTPIAAARGVIRVVNANMERAIRVITVERGFDPRDFALMAFGGAGPMHACELALDLGIRHIVLPRNPGLLCAWGALRRRSDANIRSRCARPRRISRNCSAGARGRWSRSARKRTDRRRREAPRAIRHRAACRCALPRPILRNRSGSSTPRFVADFHAAHRRTFGHAAPEAAVEVVNLAPARACAGASRDSTPTRMRGRRAGKPVSGLKQARVIVGDRASRSAGLCARDASARVRELRGPAIVVELSATAYVAPEFTLRCDDFGNLHLEAAMKLDAGDACGHEQSARRDRRRDGRGARADRLFAQYQRAARFFVRAVRRRAASWSRRPRIFRFISARRRFRCAPRSNGWTLEPGDVAAVNDPFAGGTHLPDVTLVAPIFLEGERTPVRLRREPRASRGYRRDGAGLDGARDRDLSGRLPPAAGAN